MTTRISTKNVSLFNELTAGQLFAEDVKVRFNLRQTKNRTKPTPLYMVVRSKGAKRVLSLGVKVRPWQWSNERQRAIVSNLYDGLDNFSNDIANQAIAQALELFKSEMKALSNSMAITTNCSTDIDKDIDIEIDKDIVLYNNIDNNSKNIKVKYNRKLTKNNFIFSNIFSIFVKKKANSQSKENLAESSCNVQDVSGNSLSDVAGKKIKTMAEDAGKPRKVTTAKLKAKGIDTIKIYEKAFEQYFRFKERKTSSEKSNLELRGKVNQYIEETNQISNVGVFSQQGLNGLREFFQAKKNVSDMRVNQICDQFQKIINNILTQHTDYAKYDFQAVKYKRLKDERSEDEKGHFALTKEEVEAFANVKGLSKTLERYQRHFLLMVESGVRYSDLGKLLSGCYEIDRENQILTLETQKGKGERKKQKANIPLTDRLIALLEASKGDKVNKDSNVHNFGSYIRRIAKMANLNRIIEQRDTFYNRTDAPIYETLKSHCARHTFATWRAQEGYSSEAIGNMLGHVDDSMVKAIYAHVTNDDKKQRQVEERKRIEAKQKEAISAAPLQVADLSIFRKQWEAEQMQDNRRAAIVFGVDYYQVEECATLDEVNRLLYKVEGEYIRKGLDPHKFKGVWEDSTKTLKEKKAILMQMIGEA